MNTVVADVNGSAVYALPDGVPGRSIWFAIDMQTRDFVVASPPEFSPRAFLALPTMVSGAQGVSDAINIESDLADVLLIRPGAGAWGGSCGRNSGKDLNRGKSGKMQMSFDQLTPSKTVAPPTRILLSDLVIVVDSETLFYYAGSINP
jgi:hypothetical protein